MAQSPNPPEFSRKRPWLAVLLTVFIPGLGHLYLRLWGRAILWLGLSILASYFFFPEGAVPDSISTGAFVEASQALSAEAAIVLFGVSAFCIIDVYIMARQINAYVASQQAGGTENVTRCPNCRRELDPDINFCHWCTTELDTNDE